MSKASIVYESKEKAQGLHPQDAPSASWLDVGSFGKCLECVYGDLVVLSCNVLGNVPWAFLVTATPGHHASFLDCHFDSYFSVFEEHLMDPSGIHSFTC